jgi:hypothetical protein
VDDCERIVSSARFNVGHVELLSSSIVVLMLVGLRSDFTFPCSD